MHKVTKPAPVRLPYPPKIPFLAVTALVMLGVALGTATFLAGNSSVANAQPSVNPDCTLIVPEQPLSAQGLATPYQLTATDPAMGPCHETNTAQSAFVQGVIFDAATNNISVYNPLVVDQGSQPAVAPDRPTLPQGAVVALWFGFNGADLKLQDAHGSILQGQCVNGLGSSLFGQYAYCNAPTFFTATNKAIQQGALTPPALGKAQNGLPCPTTRDFSIVDMDQSDNVPTSYLALPDGRTAQNTAVNRDQLNQPAVLGNPSDNKLLTGAVLPAIGCQAWTVPDLADPGHVVTALPLNELQAAAYQRSPVALVPAGDPMVLVNDQPNLVKLNLYRAGVDQPLATSLDQADTGEYCKNLRDVAPPRLFFDAPLTREAASPTPATSNSLFTFLALRFNTTWSAEGLNCEEILHQPSSIIVITKDNIAVDAKIR